MQHVDEAELAAGRVNDIEASISGQNQLDIEVDIRAGEGPRGTGRVLRSAASFRASTRPLWSTVPRPLGHVIDTRSLAFLSSWGLRFRKTHEPPFWRPFRAEEQLKSASCRRKRAALSPPHAPLSGTCAGTAMAHSFS